MTRFVAGNRITLLESGTGFFPALEAACDAATREIYLETYIFADDETGRRIAAALTRASQRGVVVYVLVDGFGSKGTHERFIYDLRHAGMQVLIYRPEVSAWRIRRHRLRRMHRKLAAIDGRVAFVGGINIIDDMHTPKHTPPRFDYAVQIEGPLLADIRSAMTQLWTLVAWSQFQRRLQARRTVGPRPPSCGDQRAAFVIRDNLRHRGDIEDAYLEAIAAARSEIIIASSYFLPGLSFRHALLDAAARGVRVILLLQGRVEYMLLHYATRALYGHFLDSGIEIHEYGKSFLHAKVAVIDGEWATVGSSNIDPFSLLLAREANVMIRDTRFADTLRQSLFRALRDGAVQVQPKHWRRHSLPQRVATWLCYGLVRFATGISGYGGTQESR